MIVKTDGSFAAVILRDAATSWDLGTKAGCSSYQSVVIGRCTGTNWIVINWMDTALIASISICQSTHPLHGGLAGGESGYFQCRNRTAAGYIALVNQMWSFTLNWIVESNVISFNLHFLWSIHHCLDPNSIMSSPELFYDNIYTNNKQWIKYRDDCEI